MTSDPAVFMQALLALILVEEAHREALLLDLAERGQNVSEVLVV